MIVKLVRRPLWKRVLLFPCLWWQHYKILRQHHSPYHSGFWASVLTRLTLRK